MADSSTSLKLECSDTLASCYSEALTEACDLLVLALLLLGVADLLDLSSWTDGLVLLTDTLDLLETPVTPETLRSSLPI